MKLIITENQFKKVLIKELNDQNKKDLDIIYRSKDLVVLAPHNHKIASKYSTNTEWCSQSESGFCLHSTNEVLFRFLFKDGYKMRLNLRKDGLVGSWGGPKHQEDGYPILDFKRSPKNLKLWDSDDSFDHPATNILKKRILSIDDNIIKLCIKYANKQLIERQPNSDVNMDKILSTIRSIIDKVNHAQKEAYVFSSKRYEEEYKKIYNVANININNQLYKFYFIDNNSFLFNNKKYNLSQLEEIIRNIFK